jgi:hypothetical protein
MNVAFVPFEVSMTHPLPRPTGGGNEVARLRRK